MKLLHFYPSGNAEGVYRNPYSYNYKKSISEFYKLTEPDNIKPNGAIGFILLKRAFCANIFILNWIENIGSYRGGWIQILCTIISIIILKVRRGKVVWMFHNIQPHEGFDKKCRIVTDFLFKRSDLIICHSKLALKYVQTHTKTKSVYICHPITEYVYEHNKNINKEYDILIWGSILPYKGVVEFLSNTQIQTTSLRIHIIGKAPEKYAYLSRQIHAFCNSNISYDENRVEYENLKLLISKSRYVLFPYIGGSISSSGALIDTIVMGGTPIGPMIGAFEDLSEERVCITYKCFTDLFQILQTDRKIQESCREKFLKENTWKCFAEKVHLLIENV